MTFATAILFILEKEGGYVADQNDPGGATNFGISQASYPDLNIKLLTSEIASDIYKQDYWDALKLDDMPDVLKLSIFDAAVNQGKSRAIKMLQSILNIVQDGYIGPMTFAALKDKNFRSVFTAYQTLRHDHYTQDIRWPSFGKGWSKRLLDVTLVSIGGLNGLQ